MLKFEIHDDNYRITETVMSLRDTRLATLDYTRDLSKKRCDDDPWAPTIEADRDWFNKHYMKHFKKLT